MVGPQSVATPPEDGYIIGFKPGLVGPDGAPPVEQVHMHRSTTPTCRATSSPCASSTSPGGVSKS